jgi:hypothetical protein
MTQKSLAWKIAGYTCLAAAGIAGTGGCATDVKVLNSRGDQANAAGGSANAANQANAAGGSANAADGGGASNGAGSGGTGVDLYVMFDQSSSMDAPIPNDPNTTWWDAARTALETAVRSPALAGTGFGLQFFPLAGFAPTSCNAPYSTPEVEIAALPANASGLTAALRAHSPANFTPSGPALKGAIDHLKAWAPAHPGRIPAAVFVTDGFPTECEPLTIEEVARIAADGLAFTPPIRTFVIGLNLGAAAMNLDAVAAAGGTEHAIAIDDDVAATLAGSLSEVVSKAGQSM